MEKKMIWMVLGVILAFPLALIGLLITWSPGQPEPFLDDVPAPGTVPLPLAYEKLRDTYLHSLGIGTMRQMKSVITGIFLPSLQFREYTMGEKLKLWRGKIASRSADYNLWREVLSTDLAQKVTELVIPVYFFHGRYDYTCAYPLAKAYYNKLKAPVKGFYTFEESAHSPVFWSRESRL